MASISSSDRRISTSKRRLKPPLLLRDYLLDDLSSCSSNGFKSFPRRQSSSSTVRLLLDAEIKRSRLHRKRRLSRTRTTCGTALGHAVQKASMALVNAVKMLPFPSTVKLPSPTVRNKNGGFSRSFSKRLLSRSFWRSSSDDRRDSGETDRRVEPERDPEIQRWRSFGEFLQESLDQPSDQISVAVAVGDDEEVSGESSSSSSGGSEVVQSSSSLWSGESEESNENDGVEEVVEEMVEEHVGDGGGVNRSNLCTDDNRKECANEEKEQFSPVSVLENPFEDENDNARGMTSPSDQEEINVKLGRKSRRFKGLVRIEPVDLEKRIERHIENDENQTRGIIITEGGDDDVVVVEGENRANHLFARLKSRTDGQFLIDSYSTNLLSDFFQEDGNEEREDETLVKTAEEWVLDRQEEMFLSWEVKEKRGIYVKEMEMERREKWACFREERECVLEEFGNGFFASLVDELVLDLSSSF
ncbi:PREDICTED: uncharacterized protein LOC104806370 [Tarenaya hassleriana]|uniref:uncharacterized protein LOC104806370 n=1 Tax=Tarenaya hassleriana TaxID=28532 RepID=UPI00053C46AE|nr:PREDICTED: uncharacterized protein LOC104806370 [Tarenaya hassleriana]